MSNRKTILIAGLGENIPPSIRQRVQNFDPQKIVEMVRVDMVAAKAAGFDTDAFFADPNEPVATFQQFQEKLRSKKWDGVIFGGGLRAAMELTELFEDFVNASSETVPGIKFGFSTAPNEVLKCASRMFPDVKP